jgi:hypothetical protein
MKTLFVLLLSFFILFFSASSVAAWRSNLYPENWYLGYVYDGTSGGDCREDGCYLQDYSYAGYHKGEEAIPNISGPIFNVTSSIYGADGSDSNDDTSAIQHAIDDAEAAGGGVVYLPAGTYIVTPTYYAQWGGEPVGQPWAFVITKSNIVIRGDDPDSTHIFYNETYAKKGGIFRIDPNPGRNDGTWPPAAFDFKKGDWEDYNAAGDPVLISQDYSMPTKVLKLTNVSSFHIGDQIIVRDYKTSQFLADLNNPPFGDDQVRGPVFQREIVDINPTQNLIYIDIPTRYPIKSTYNASVYKIRNPIQEVGLENFSIAMREITNMVSESDSTVIDGSRAIFIRNALNCWVRNVSTYTPSQNKQGFGYITSTVPDNLREELVFNIAAYGLVIRDSRNVTVENAHFKNSQDHGEGGNGYLFVVYGNDLLIKNSSAGNGRHNIDFKGMEANGSVIYNSKVYFSPHYPSSDDNNLFGKTLQSDFHMWFSFSNLIDNVTIDGDSFLSQYRAFGNQSITSHANVFWNTNVIHSHIRGGNALITDQWGWGYVIGMRGTNNLLSIYGSQAPADPNRPDFVEPATLLSNPNTGPGSGEMLEPQSLYLDQLQKRLGGSSNQPPYVYTGQDQTVRLSEASSLDAMITDDGLPSNSLTISWSTVDGPDSAVFSQPASASTTVTFPQIGIYTLKVTANDGQLESEDTVIVNVIPDYKIGDVNRDDAVNNTDAHFVLTNYRNTLSEGDDYYDPFDDGIVNVMDFGYVISDWGNN